MGGAGDLPAPVGRPADRNCGEQRCEKVVLYWLELSLPIRLFCPATRRTGRLCHQQTIFQTSWTW